VKDLVSVLPRAARRNRGKSTLRDLYFDAAAIGARRVIVVSTWKGNPGTLRVYEPGDVPDEGLRPLAAIRLRGVRLSRETPGAARSWGSRSLGVYPVGGEEQKLLADMFVRAFLARLVLDPETPGFDSVAHVERWAGGLAEVYFTCGGRRCGPTMRIVGAVDYAAGVRLRGAARPAGGAGRLSKA